MKLEVTHNGKALTLRDATKDDVFFLRTILTKETPNARWDPRVKNGYWDGKVSYFKNDMYAPAGLWRYIQEQSEVFNLECNIVGINTLRTEYNDADRKKFQKFVKKILAVRLKEGSLELRDYQVEAAYRMTCNTGSLSLMVTSAGKTLVCYLALRWMILRFEESQKRRPKILMIVPRIGLVTQGRDDFGMYTSDGTQFDVGIKYSGFKEKLEDDIVISTYQSLIRTKKAYFDKFDIVLVDEVHTAKSTSIKTIMEKCTNAVIKFGVTGTLPPEEGLDHLTLQAYMGPCITKIGFKKLSDEGYIAKCKVKVIEMQYATDQERHAFHSLWKTAGTDRKNIIHHEKRFARESIAKLNFISSVVTQSDKNSLVLFHRPIYGKELLSKLREIGGTEFEVYYIDGGTDNDTREMLKARMEKGTKKILVASFGTFSTGINIKNLHAVHLTESFKSDIVIRQSIGRGLRQHFLKTGLDVIDYVDDYRHGKWHNYLYKHSVERRIIYEKEEFEFRIHKIDIRKFGNAKSDGGLF